MLSAHEQLTELKPHILVVSLDFDGCLFNPHYLRSHSATRLIETNQLLIDHLLAEITAGKYDRVIFMVGSNRQSKEIDDRNNKHANSGSAFSNLQLFCEHIQQHTSASCEVNGLLLADVYGNRPDGENFAKAVNAEHYAYSHYIWDEFKYTIVYGHIHKVASENPQADISYFFYDDRDDIHHYLSLLYHRHAAFIPNNTKLFFHTYNGEELQKFELSLLNFSSDIKGEGIIDKHFHENIKLMAKSCGLDPDNDQQHGKKRDSIAHGMRDPAVILHFKNQRQLSMQDLITEFQYEATRFKLQQTYQQPLLYAFYEALERCFCEIKLHLTLQNPTDDDIKKSSAYTLTKDMTALLRTLQSNQLNSHFLNPERQLKINDFINRYGLSLNRLRSSIQSVSHTVYRLFYTPDSIEIHANTLTEQCKLLLSADEEALQLELSRSQRFN